MPLPPESVVVDLRKGTASMRMSRVALADQTDLNNALQHGPAIPATVSFDVRWGAARGMKMMKMKQIRNTQHRFALEMHETPSTIDWQADRGDLKVASDAGSAKSTFSFIGREQNGVFF